MPHGDFFAQHTAVAVVKELFCSSRQNLLLKAYSSRAAHQRVENADLTSAPVQPVNRDRAPGPQHGGLLNGILCQQHAEGLLLKCGDHQLRQRFICAEAALLSGLDQLL